MTESEYNNLKVGDIVSFDENRKRVVQEVSGELYLVNTVDQYRQMKLSEKELIMDFYELHVKKLKPTRLAKKLYPDAEEIEGVLHVKL